MNQSASASSRRKTDTFLRGVAICCVVLIHVLSSLKESPFIQSAQYQLIAVAADQLSRVAVPLFVVLSGYGLQMGYQHKTLRIAEFFKKRVLKLLPLYILWSTIFWLIFFFIPAWRPTPEMKPFFLQFILGNADYHLYFVPMIFQLYLLFPLLLPLVKKFPWLALASAGIFQVLLYVVITDYSFSQLGNSFFQSDQKQYYWFFSWIFYFILGMVLPRLLVWIKQHRIAQWLLMAMVCLTGWWVVYSAYSSINSGTDPLMALRFTRIEVLAYAGSMSVAAFYWLSQHNKFFRPILFLGEHSYSIYLSHTLFLRLLF